MAVMSHSSSKKDDIMKVGAKSFISTSNAGWAEPLNRSLDLIICTTFATNMPIHNYLGLLNIGGTMVHVGIPEGELEALPPTLMIGNNSASRGGNAGSKKEVVRLLELAVKAGVESWIETMPMTKYIDAVERVERGEQRYRLCLRPGGRRIYFSLLIVEIRNFQ